MWIYLYILRILADCLNIFSRKKYYDTFSSFKPRMSKMPFFYIASLAGEFFTFSVSLHLSGLHGFYRAVCFIVINLIVNFSLSLFYRNSKLIYRLLVVFSFQTIGLISELASGIILSKLLYLLHDYIPAFQEAYIVVVSNISSFLIISIICAIHIKHDSAPPIGHTLLICSTPVFSILLLLALPYNAIISYGSSFRVFLVLVITLSMNITNHLLLNDIIRQRILEETIQNQNKQLKFQSEKFMQISNAYRETRSVIHEIKRYNSYIMACVDNHEYDKIKEFIDIGNHELEKRFVKNNTGNLVIDTLITNYENLSLDREIEYFKEISIDKDDISMNDYDLCIILGNLLDNSFDAASRWNNKFGTYNGFKIDVKILTKEKFLVVYVCNTEIKAEQKARGQYDLSHGYGIENVKRVVEKYGGVYFQNNEDEKYITTISIPIMRDSFGNVARGS